ncbi:unnamed protein product [Onchocerca flexuosa]|uniref:Transposase n=1 Tax=Onchocerca flexuosa TaxID=387005 RepID=A0A183I6F4_9BILA|nr:unnamed protein product [Onchocerca flexuosa]
MRYIFDAARISFQNDVCAFCGGDLDMERQMVTHNGCIVNRRSETLRQVDQWKGKKGHPRSTTVSQSLILTHNGPVQLA